MATEKRGDSNKITREYFDSILLETRYIGADTASTKFRLFGETFDTPIMTAALSHMHRAYENGMVELAKGARDAGAVYWTGMGDMEELEAIVATGAKTVKIIKPYEDNDEIFRRIEHAVKTGVMAVGMDIDHAFSADGGYDNVLGYAMKPKSFEEMKAFVQAASGVPFIVKGILSVSDARKCLQAGVQGIVVSHHHGIMDYSVPPLLVLPDIVKAVGAQMTIFVDCCVESGMDAFKALALGADAVCVGQNLIPALTGGGAEGVKQRICELNGQLRGVMSRTGARTLEEIDGTVLHMRNF